MRPHTLVGGAVLALGWLAGSARLQAQMDELSHFGNHRHVGLGYVISAPRMYVGVNALALQARGFGLYADFKFATDSPGDEATCCPYSVAEAEGFGDWRFQDKSAWRSFNVALVRVVASQLAVYAGGGISRQKAYRRYADLTGQRDPYWVQDDGGSGNRLNLLGGLLFHASRHIVFVIGGEMRPRGVTVGLTLALPRPAGGEPADEAGGAPARSSRPAHAGSRRPAPAAPGLVAPLAEMGKRR